MQHNFIIDSWSFKQGQSPEKLNDVSLWQSGAWFHCQRSADGLEEWLTQIGLSGPIIDALLAEDTRPRFQPLDDGNFLMILRGVNLNEGEQPDDMLSLRMLFYKNSLITMRKKPFKAISKVREQLEQGIGPKSVKDLLIAIVDQLHQRIEDVVENAELQIDEIQENIDAITYQEQRKLTYLHRQLLKLNRFLKPQTTALTELLDSNYEHEFSKHQIQRLHNQRDVMLRVIENVEAYIDQVWMLREHIQQALAEKMNRNTYSLSLIAGVFLPLGFLTGLLGVNLGGIPGSESGDAFTMFCVALGVVGVVEFLLLRRLKFW